MYLILNIIVWFWPLFFLREFTRLSYFLAALLFSQSYYFYSIIQSVFATDIRVSITEEFVSQAIIYSVIAGIFYSTTFILSIGAKGRGSWHLLYNNLLYGFKILPTLKISFFLSLFLIYFIWLEIFDLVQYVGAFDRGYWWSSSLRGNYSSKMTMYGVFASVLVAINIKTYRNQRLILLLNLFLVLSHVIFVSFDGSRRELLLPLISIFLSFFYYRSQDRKSVANLYLIGGLILLVLIVYSMLGRGTVGWSSFLRGIEFDVANFMFNLLAPMPTLHVTTAMINYVDMYGIQGGASYLSAAMNTLVPRFVWGSYVGGEPLVLRIHQELGWRGFDFGFLAESIYAYGLFGVMLMHSLVGLYHGTLIRLGIKYRSFILFAFLMSYHLALVQALRSDFMNLLKWSVYPAVFIISLHVFFKVAKRISSK